MDTFEKVFRASFEEALSFKTIGAEMIARQLARQGITLSKEQLVKIESGLENIEGDSLIIQIDDLVCENDGQDDLVIKLDNLADVDEIVNRITEKITDALPEVISETSSVLLDQWLFGILRERATYRTAPLTQTGDNLPGQDTNVGRAWRRD
ncbi:MAG: hypothetical protein NT169_22655 [Chloroflexi bacterium]|nr:hypothetical protein [Chloroflexota bacterium]